MTRLTARQRYLRHTALANQANAMVYSLRRHRPDAVAFEGFVAAHAKEWSRCLRRLSGPNLRYVLSVLNAGVIACNVKNLMRAHSAPIPPLDTIVSLEPLKKIADTFCGRMGHHEDTKS